MVKLINEENVDITRLDLLQNENLLSKKLCKSILLLDECVFDHPYSAYDVDLPMYTELVWYNIVNIVYNQLKLEYNEIDSEIEVKLFKTRYTKFCQLYVDNFMIFEMTQNEGIYELYFYIPKKDTIKYSILERLLDIIHIEKLVGSDYYGRFLDNIKKEYKYSLNIGNLYFKKSE